MVVVIFGFASNVWSMEGQGSAEREFSQRNNDFEELNLASNASRQEVEDQYTWLNITRQLTSEQRAAYLRLSEYFAEQRNTAGLNPFDRDLTMIPQAQLTNFPTPRASNNAVPVQPTFSSFLHTLVETLDATESRSITYNPANNSITLESLKKQIEEVSSAFHQSISDGRGRRTLFRRRKLTEEITRLTRYLRNRPDMHVLNNNVNNSDNNNGDHGPSTARNEQ